MTASPDPRGVERADFLAAAGWGSAEIQPFPGDASTRRYFRLTRHGKPAVLMDAPSGAEAPACPADADAATRKALGYNAEARLAGNNAAAFAGIAEALTARGFSAPKIYEADLDAGLLLIEDLGDDLFARVIPGRAHEGALYAAAIDTIASVYRSSFEREPAAWGKSWTIQEYDPVALRAEADLFVEWYAGRRCGTAPTPALRADWASAWDQVMPALEGHAQGLCLRDFHAENLIWLPDRAPEARTGLLDFQDALFGHPAYDLVSLLEDARRDVSPHIVGPLKDRYYEASGLSDRAAFDAAYAVLAAQRNAKILGIFVRLVERDGKRRYLDFMGRVARHFVQDLDHPALAPVRAVVRDAAPDVYAEADR